MIWFDLSPLNALGGPWTGAVVCIALGVLIGMLGAMLGIGGGFVVTPLLHAGLRMSAAQAVATSTGQIPLMALSGVMSYFRRGMIDFRFAALLLVTSVPAAQIVAYWLGNIRHSTWANQPAIGRSTMADLVVLVTFSLLIGGVGIYNLRSGRRAAVASEPRDGAAEVETKPVLTPRRVIGTTGMGIIFGAFSALLGIGGGFFAVPLFVYLCGLPPVRAVATSLVAVLVTSAITATHYAWMGEIYVGISLLIAVGGVAGAQIGARVAVGSKPGFLLTFLGGLQISAATVYIAAELLR